MPIQGTVGHGIICSRSGGKNKKSERLILSNLSSCSPPLSYLWKFLWPIVIRIQEHYWTLFSGVFDLIYCFLVDVMMSYSSKEQDFWRWSKQKHSSCDNEKQTEGTMSLRYSKLAVKVYILVSNTFFCKLTLYDMDKQNSTFNMYLDWLFLHKWKRLIYGS